MDVNRISGYIPGKIVFFLMQARKRKAGGGERERGMAARLALQWITRGGSPSKFSGWTGEAHPLPRVPPQVCKSGLCRPRKIWLTRHGESEYNSMEKIGGDSDLTPLGREYAALLAETIVDRIPADQARQLFLFFKVLKGGRGGKSVSAWTSPEHNLAIFFFNFKNRGGENSLKKNMTSPPWPWLVALQDGHLMPVSVWTSTLRRTIQTAAELPFPKLRWKILDEINAGACDGLTYDEIAKGMPEEFDARKKDKLR